MKITQLDTYFLSCPLPEPVHTSNSTISQVNEVLVKIKTDVGIVGIGQGHGPFLLQQGADGLRLVSRILHQITPLIIGEDPFNVERIWQTLFALTYTSVRGVPTLAKQQRQLITAMSAIDIALWDIMGKATERPVYALMGGALHDRIPAYVTGFYYKDGETLDDLRRETTFYLEKGYRILKVKVGRVSPKEDAERLRVIRETAGDSVDLMLDANQGWSLSTAIEAAQRCAPYNIFWLEDPMPWYDERYTMQRLKAATSIPIAAGETEYSPFGLRHFLAEGLVDYLIIDSTWAGGLTTWRKAAVMAEMYQIPLAAHHDPQIHIHAQVASPTAFILESFADPARDPLWFNLFSERPEIVDGFMSLPTAPGLGITLRDDTLDKFGAKIS